MQAYDRDEMRAAVTRWESLSPTERLREELQQYLKMIGVSELESICRRLIDTAGELAEALGHPAAKAGNVFAIRRRRRDRER